MPKYDAAAAPEAIRAARARSGLTCAQAAAMLGIRGAQWWRWEHGRARMRPDLLRLFEMAIQTAMFAAPPSFQRITGKRGTWLVRRAGDAWSITGPEGHPVTCTSWAQAFCLAHRRADKRVPAPSYVDPETVFSYDAGAFSVSDLTG